MKSIILHCASYFFSLSTLIILVKEGKLNRKIADNIMIIAININNHTIVHSTCQSPATGLRRIAPRQCAARASQRRDMKQEAVTRFFLILPYISYQMPGPLFLTPLD